MHGGGLAEVDEQDLRLASGTTRIVSACSNHRRGDAVVIIYPSHFPTSSVLTGCLPESASGRIPDVARACRKPPAHNLAHKGVDVYTRGNCITQCPAHSTPFPHPGPQARKRSAGLMSTAESACDPKRRETRHETNCFWALGLECCSGETNCSATQTACCPETNCLPWQGSGNVNIRRVRKAIVS